VNEDGFSLLETMLATVLLLLVTGGVFSMMHPEQGSFAAQTEAADLQQRLRVGQEGLSRDIIMAGAGSYAGQRTGPLINYFGAVLPFRQGAVNADPVGTFATDRITVLYVPSTNTQTTLSEDLIPGGSTLKVYSEGAGSCPRDGSGHPIALCGITKDTTLLVFDSDGNYDTFTVTAVNDDIATVSVNRSNHLMTTTYVKDKATVAEVRSRTYYLKSDVASSTYQLMRYDGAFNADVPVLDHVVGLQFDYYGEPAPPMIRKPIADSIGPWTTYGPKPSVAGVGNCLFTGDAPPAAKLPTLGDGGEALVPLSAAQLSDGPWCPDEFNANRWDADLLRIRKIGVTLRVQAAVAALRGPAGVLFARGGTSRGGNKWVPDQEVRFQISPRNLNPGR